MKTKIFLSSYRNDFINERLEIKKRFENDDFLSKSYEIFVFEVDVPSVGKSPDEIYLEEAERSDIYIGLLGKHYGNVRDSGYSATEEEYRAFIRSNPKENAFFFVTDETDREEKINEFISKLLDEVTYNKFKDIDDLWKLIKNSLGDLNSRSTIFEEKYDKLIVYESSKEDIDIEAFNEFIRLYGEEKPENPYDFLEKKLGVLVKDMNGYHLTTAGILFFGKDPTKYSLTNFKVKLARFNGTKANNFQDSLILEDNFFNILNEVERFVKRNTRKASKIVDFIREDIEEYPYNAVRESIVNALAHRNYTLSATDITLQIYEDRIEIISPGKLIYPVNEYILNNESIIISAPRNKEICKIFHFTKYMETYGTGIGNIKEEMKKHNLPKPEFKLIGEFFQVILWGPNENIVNLPSEEEKRKTENNEIKLNKRQEKLLEYLDENKYISTKQYQNLFNISYSTAKRDIGYLVKHIYIKKVKTGRQIYYTLY